MSSVASITEARALALLGDKPCMTLVDPNDPDVCLSVRLVREGSVWLGLVDDRAALLDRVRMGLEPRFVVHPDASTSTVSGELAVHVLGRADAFSAAQPARATAVAGLEPFGFGGAVVIEVAPRALVLEPVEASSVTGAVPRT